jgi:hypothetical protein
MERMQKHFEPILATLAGGATTTGVLDGIDHMLSIAVAVATLAWWVRLWIKNPNVKPPTLKDDEKK